MLETCVHMYYCGTHAPGWLSGGHPLLADGVVQRKVCFIFIINIYVSFSAKKGQNMPFFLQKWLDNLILQKN